MSDLVVVTTSYPRHQGDAEGHFVSAEVRRLCRSEADAAAVTVLAPGLRRPSLWGERVVSLDGGSAFGFPGALERVRRDPRELLGAAQFVWSAIRWLSRAPAPRRVVAHFLLPCGVPIASRGLGQRGTHLEVVVHGSDARLFAQSPGAHSWVGRELLRAHASLRFVSTELRDLVLDSLPAAQCQQLAPRARVEPSPVDVSGVPARALARAQLGLAPDAKLGVVVARLVPGKRVDVALAACARIPPLRMLVLGDGPERGRLQRQFPSASFMGHVTRPLTLSYIAAADVLVSASLDEGAPSVVREARALGTPVVCLQAGDVLHWAASDPGLSVVPLAR